MKNKTIYQVMTATLVSFTMFGYAQAQTAPVATSESEFKKELVDAKRSITGDMEAQKIQQEIRGDDDEIAGDTHGDAKEIEGEKDQSEIDTEIEQEAETESASEATAEGTSESGSTETSTSSSEGN